MSRIGKKNIVIPAGAKVSINGDVIKVEGPKGSLVQPLSKELKAVVSGSEMKITRNGEDKKTIMLHGLTRSLIANMVKGVTEGFQKSLEIVGVGYRAEIQGSVLNLSLGYSHPIKYTLPKGITAAVDKQTSIILKGMDKQLLGQTAAEIRAFRLPDPYKGKGIKYTEEVVRRKAGKAGKATGGGKAA
ncbi:MAG: 50S ribosomal protein L6 [Deltaproteobacteria bacterium]|nr:50S ribosomal protein L6 [Deltaproteobacteria bacterium]